MINQFIKNTLIHGRVFCERFIPGTKKMDTIRSAMDWDQREVL